MKITLTTYKNNSVYSLYVTKYGREHHLGYINSKELNSVIKNFINVDEEYDKIQKPCPEQEREAAAIGAMIKSDRTYFTDNMGNHRDGLD